MNLPCPCGSNRAFKNCCEPFILEKTYPETAEELMRSRYSAYVVIAADYLVKTTHISRRKQHNKKEIERWEKENKWQNLQIIATEKGQKENEKGIVEFKAYYINAEGLLGIHHEKSSFLKENQKWFYLSGEIKS